MKAKRANESWVRILVKKPKPNPKSKPKVISPLIVEMPLGRGVIMMPSLWPEPVSPPEPDTEYLALPFLREHDLENECIEILKTDCYSFRNPSEVAPYFSKIPAIKRSREVMGWNAITAKDFVDKVYKNNAGQIEAHRLACIEKWKAKWKA